MATATATATATETEFLGSSSSSQSPTKPSTPTNSAPPLSQRRLNDTCCNCRNKGHWAANCPFKTTPSQPPSQSPSQKACRFSSSPSPSSSADTSFFSPIPCPNGHGSCSAKNPDRPYYSCSKGKCNFLKCDDEMAVAVESGGGGGGSNSKTKRDRSRSRDGNPECPCGAGNCMVVSEAKGKFFVCPIERGHGACSFRRGVDDARATNTVTPDLTEGGQGSYLSPKRTKFESPVMDNPDPLSTPVGHDRRIEEIGVESKDHDDILDLFTIEEIVRAEAELEKSLQVSRLPSQAVRRRQVEFMRQISASEYATVADPIQQMLGTLITGWLGRLAFPPKTGCLTVPQAKPFFCRVFPSFDPISVPKDVDVFYSANINDQPHHSPMNAEPDSSLQILSQDSQSGILLELSSIQNIPGMRRGRDYTGQISKALAELGSHVQNQLLAMLESTEPHNHRSMTEAANKTFSVLSSLSIDYRSFSEHVRKFISCASSLAEMEESMMAEQSTEEIMEWYDNERANCEKISTMQAETKDAVTASEQQLKSLGEEASRLKEMLLQIEDQLRHCKKENAELKIKSRKISEDMLESGKKLQEAEAAKKLREERERQKNAAKESLERARIQLRHSVYMV